MWIFHLPLKHDAEASKNQIFFVFLFISHFFTLSCIIRKLGNFFFSYCWIGQIWKEIFILPTLETNYRNRYCMLLISIEFLPILRNIISESAAVSQIIYFENMNDDYKLWQLLKKYFWIKLWVIWILFGFTALQLGALCKSIPFSSLSAGL